jgi:ribonucleoside-diphosphate reductase alpha chain
VHNQLLIGGGYGYGYGGGNGYGNGDSYGDGYGNGMQTKHGSGTSAYFGALRGRGRPIRGNGESSGSVHFMEFFDTLINLVSQGKTRRGNFAAYQDIGHPDIMEFLSIRSEGHPIQDLSFGVCVPDAWMQSMIDGDAAKRDVWARVLARRQESGFPYVLFTGNATRGMPDCYRDRGLAVTQSNLCTEIMLPNGPEESFVCDLSSMNTLHFDEWEGTDAVEVLLCVLDAVMSEFVEKAWQIPYLERAARFAERHRAVGIGWLGWHSCLQSRMIAYESMEAKLLNLRVAREIKEKAYAASARLAAELGEPEMLKGYGRRHSTLLAIAPTKSSAFILGQASENAEPERSNYYIKDLAKVKHTVRNPYLAAVLAAHGRDDAPTWAAILKSGGSVQALDFLSERERAVFRTFAEISPKEVVIQAAGRQKWIDQGQSLNLMIHPSVPVRDVNALLIEGWRLGVKSFYYQLGVNAAQSFSRDILSCASCDG